jgi:hypothetical protein
MVGCRAAVTLVKLAQQERQPVRERSAEKAVVHIGKALADRNGCRLATIASGALVNSAGHDGFVFAI